MLNTSEIKSFIEEDIISTKKRLAKEGQRYYEAEHDILKCRLFYYNADGNLVEDKTRSNIKICHPFFTELSDQLSSYMLSFNENPIQAKDTAEGLQEKLDLYFDDDFWTETGDLIGGAYNKGFDYIYGYKSAENRLRFEYADGLGVVEVEARFASDEQNHVLYWYIDRIDKEGKAVKYIQDWTTTETYYYVQIGEDEIELDKDVPINPRPHIVFTDQKTGKKMGKPFGFIPFWRLDNNRKQISGLKPIKSLIDDYDLMQCGLSNNLTDFDTPLHVVSGFQGDNLDELQQNLKTKKIVGVDSDGSVSVQTVDVPYQARQAKANDDEKNIYRFGLGLNTSGLKDTSATTNLAIKSAYALLDMKANKMEKRLKKLLKDIVKVVLDEINEEYGTGYQISDVVFNFTRTTMTNEKENIEIAKLKADTKQVEVNTILNVAASIGEEKALKLICEQLDIDFEEIKGELDKLQEEQNAAAAKTVLSAVVPEDEPPEE
jgi:SPP1 family phage portal protein